MSALNGFAANGVGGGPGLKSTVSEDAASAYIRVRNLNLGTSNAGGKGRVIAVKNIKTWMRKMGYPTEVDIRAAGFALADAFDGPQGWPFESSLCRRVIDALQEGRLDSASFKDMLLLSACSDSGDFGGEMRPRRTRSNGNINRLQDALCKAVQNKPAFAWRLAPVSAAWISAAARGYDVCAGLYIARILPVVKQSSSWLRTGETETQRLRDLGDLLQLQRAGRGVPGASAHDLVIDCYLTGGPSSVGAESGYVSSQRRRAAAAAAAAAAANLGPAPAPAPAPALTPAPSPALVPAPAVAVELDRDVAPLEGFDWGAALDDLGQDFGLEAPAPAEGLDKDSALFDGFDWNAAVGDFNPDFGPDEAAPAAPVVPALDLDFDLGLDLVPDVTADAATGPPADAGTEQEDALLSTLGAWLQQQDN
ncbi:hypothetical protein JDV02_000688 [Purpureocillium takamizusanense]|uniref:Uncharacterized protein n=1 Tax=Purpureocillium takamizusanense TaxID=2060973 RepID=A0A9Q8Q5C0_9HYPO|nr:uncharacterized protein JDV02_000688 [Purpureocillium takamizusanense]UNI14004.1 hypothetical protein JDV02_000688 [Purpureocillium takamizusanense]